MIKKKAAGKATYKFDVSITTKGDGKPITKEEINNALRKHFKATATQVGYPTVWRW